MKHQLYFAPGACSFVPHAMLQIAGADFEPVMVKLHKGEQHSDAYKAINPRGQVPVLVISPSEPPSASSSASSSATNAAAPTVLTQILAIISYLNDAFPAAQFLPSDPVAKAQALATLAWMNNTVHPTFTHIFMPHKFSDNTAIHDDLRAYNRQLYAAQLAELDALVVAMNARQAPYLLGSNISPLDLYALTLTRWGGIAGIDPAANNADLWAHVQKVAAHPAVAEVVARERLQLNVFAAAG
jgi:glutathione S-transferase